MNIEKTKKLQPMNDHVLVKRAERAEKTRGGLFIPDNAKELPVEGEVLAVGPGRVGEDGHRQELEVKRGDRVLFGKFAGEVLDVEGESFAYVILKESDIYCVLSPGAKLS